MGIIHLCIAGLIAGVIGELWIRAFVPAKNICYLSDPVIGAKFCPNQRTYGYVEKGYSNIFATNSLGFHDVERPRHKPPGTFRIQVYGDSMIQGYCVPLEKTIPRLLEKYLNDGSLPYRVEVLNMASGDDGTSCQVMTYQEIGRHLEPDLVISNFMDDFPDNVVKIHGRLYSPYHQLLPDGTLKLIPPTPKDITTLWERFKRHSKLYRHSANRVLESKLYSQLVKIEKNVSAFIRTVRTGRGESRPQDFDTYRKEVCVKESWPVTLSIIEHFDQMVKANGSRFLLLEAAKFYEETVASVYSNDDFEKALEKRGVPYLRVYEEYERINNANDPEKYFFKDSHLKAVGNEEVARFIAAKLRDVLKSQGLSPASRVPSERAAARAAARG